MMPRANSLSSSLTRANANEVNYRVFREKQIDAFLE